jgi:hypothetical protein
MKFKVGDKVKVRNDLVENKNYSGIIMNNHMMSELGKETTVEEVSLAGGTAHLFCSNGYYMREEMLETIGKGDKGNEKV